MRKTCNQGLSLIELLITLAIATIIVILSTPNLIGFIEHNRAYNTRQSIASGMSFTRGHAITYQRLTEMCGSSDGSNCDHQWSQGWLVRVGNEQKVLRSEQFAGVKDRLSWGRSESTIRYMPNGTAPTSNSRFLYCTHTNGSWRIVLNRQGRGRIEFKKRDEECP